MRLTFATFVLGMLPVVSGCYGGYRDQRYDRPPAHVDDLGDGRHYQDHHVFYGDRGREHDYHHIHHYDD